MSTDVAPDERQHPLVIAGLDGLRGLAGTKLGVSRWERIDQESIDTFARLTGDEQWIHVDPERAKDGPFGSTVAHGFMTLGKSTGLLWDVAVVDGVGVILNYGLNKVRFPSPVRVGSRVRMHVSIAEVKEVQGGLEVVYHLEYETEGEAKPPCVADLVFRYYS
ncbi:MAG TPA: MaoC family dehydratase [Dermatophilaceae bacterium]|nr:MaoC family dehydratase [Dermatophilaceae bacterium]